MCGLDLADPTIVPFIGRAAITAAGGCQPNSVTSAKQIGVDSHHLTSFF
jgi:hypothetical protein